MPDFGAQLREIARRRGEDLEKVGRGVTLRIFNAVARDTRVDTGRLRGNWQVTQNAPVAAAIERIDPRLGAPLAAAQQSQVEPFALNILSNALPYAAVWEDRDGMIARAVADVVRAVEAEVATYK